MRFPISARRGRVKARGRGRGRSRRVRAGRARVRAGGAPSIGQAAALGLLHGPVELLPVSSSGHVALVPWLLGWEYPEARPEARKAFEVALHAGTAAALLITSWPELASRVDRRQLRVAAGATGPPAVAGLLLKPLIERRLGTASTIAAGLASGSLLMLIADAVPEERSAADADWADGFCLGVAQAGALVPGVSRSGATLATARLRAFRRPDATRLSREVGLPVILGAATLEALELRRRALEPGWALPLAAGAGAAFGSTLMSVRAIRPDGGQPLTGWALYRLVLAAVILLRRRSGERP